MHTIDPRTDQQLITALNAGEASAFDVLYYRYRDWAYRLAYRFTRDEHDALDVLQETFVYLARKFPGFTLTASMTTFLYPVVKNTALAVLRQRPRATSIDAANPAAVYASMPAANPREVLAAVLSRVSEASREVLLMRFVDEMKIEEIASALGVPAGTVKSRLHNALQSLREDQRTQRYFDDLKK